MEGEDLVDAIKGVRYWVCEREEVAVLAEHAQQTVGSMEHVVRVSAQSYPLRSWHDAYSIGLHIAVMPKAPRKMYRPRYFPGRR